MDLLLRLFAIAATAVFLLAVLLVLLTFRRARRVTAGGLLVPVGMSLVVLALYCAILGATPSAAWLVTGLVAGALVGMLWARTHRLFRGSDGAVRSRANLWYLVVWAVVLALNQIVAVVAGRSSGVLVGLLVLSTGIAIGNGLVLLRRLRRLRATAAALAMGLAFAGSAARADDVLLLLPREFDVKPLRDHPSTATGRVIEPMVFRFRGEEVAGGEVVLYAYPGQVPSGHWTNYTRSVLTLEGAFRRGHLDGTLTLKNTQWAEGSRNLVCEGVQAEGWTEGRVSGTATADGRLDLTLRWQKEWGWGFSHGSSGTDPSHQATCDQKVTYSRPPIAESQKPIVAWVLQLPVGALQSSVKPKPPPPPEPKPATAREEAHRDVPAPAVEPEPGRGDEADGGGSEPVSPEAAAAAAATAAGVSLLGALFMLVSTGVRPGDLLAPPPAMDVEMPVAHGEGDVNPETGDRWSEFDRGWIGADEYARRHGADQAEIARAQQVSDDESRRRFVERVDALRASEARQGEAAAAQASAARTFELEAALRPQKIEPYTPAWSDRVTSGLELVEGVADTSMSLLSELTGTFGKFWGKVYTVGKETVKGTSEGVAAYARGHGGVLAGKGSAWVIAERAGIGLAKGGASVGLDEAAGKLLEGVAKRARRSIPELPDLGKAAVEDVVSAVASDTGEAAARRAVGIAVGKTAGSQAVQAPVGMAVKAATGEI